MVHKSTTPKKKESSVNQTLVHNLVELQKIHANLLEKMSKVSDQLTELLLLFEGAAKKFGQQTPQNTEKDKEFLEKVDKLLEQNKTLAKGLTIMEEKIRSSQPQIHNSETEEISSETKPLPRF